MPRLNSKQPPTGQTEPVPGASPLVHVVTIEDRLAAKADAADRADTTGRRSLGQMSREERSRVLFGE